MKSKLLRDIQGAINSSETICSRVEDTVAAEENVTTDHDLLCCILSNQCVLLKSMQAILSAKAES